MSGRGDDGRTLGTPMMWMVRNRDAKSSDYREMEHVYRPSHADLTYDRKYGRRAWAGGGRASARETIGRVIAGAVARVVLRERFGVDILGYVVSVGSLEATVTPGEPTLELVESNVVRCPEGAAAVEMEQLILDIKASGDSVGGIVQVEARGVPVGWGGPVFDKLEADLAKALLSIPACKGFEIGSGFAGAALRGSEHNDEIRWVNDRPQYLTNNAGGILGGISNGDLLVARAAFKPTATLMRSQRTIDDEGNEVELKGRGRHDPCVVPRAVPIVEAMVAITLLDHALVDRAQCGDVVR